MAVRFDALGDAYSATTGLPAGGDISFTCWVKLVVDRNAFSHLLHVWNDTGALVFVSTASNGTTLQFFDGTRSAITGLDSYALTVGTWYGVIGSVDSTAGTVTFGTMPAGGVLASDTATATQVSTPNNLRISGNTSGTFLNGTMAAVKIWDVPLTVAQLADELTQYQPSVMAGLLRYHPFVNPETADYSGNNFTLTAGTATKEDGPPIRWGPSRPRLILPAAAPTATGSVSGSLPPAAGSITGTATCSGTLAGSAPALTGSVSATATASGAVSGTPAAATASVAGASVAAGSMAGQLLPATGGLSGAAVADGTLQGTASAPTGGLTGDAAVAGSLDAGLPGIVGAAAGTAAAQGSVEATASAVAGTFTGAGSTAGAVAATLPLATGSLSGVVDTGGGTLAADLPVPTADLSGLLSTAGALLPTGFAPVLALAGVATTVGVLNGVTPAVIGAWTGTAGAVDLDGSVRAGAPVVAADPHTSAPVVVADPHALAPVAAATGPHALAPALAATTQAGPLVVTRAVTSGPPHVTSG